MHARTVDGILEPWTSKRFLGLERRVGELASWHLGLNKVRREASRVNLGTSATWVDHLNPTNPSTIHHVDNCFIT